jgi:undecaprenyl-diphosphatase
MLETLLDIDKKLFTLINTGFSNKLFDFLCPVMRNQMVWYPFYLLCLYLLYKQYGTKTIYILLLGAILVLVCDQLSANLIKNAVQRLRPCNNPEIRNSMRLLVHCGSGYSFVSAHATNHFAIAYFVGVHFPADVFAGCLLGLSVSVLFVKFGLSKIIHLTHE